MDNIGYSGRGCIIYIPPDGSELEMLLGLEEPPSFERENEVPKLWWQLPGGGVKSGETVQEAIMREGFEETGISLDPVKLNDSPSVSYKKESKKEDESHHITTVSLYVTNRKESISPGDDIRKVNWFSFSKIPFGRRLFRSTELNPLHRKFVLLLLTNPDCVEYLRSIGQRSEDLLALLPFGFEDN